MIKVVTILGAGTMGHGIAHAAMAGGFETRLFDVSGEMLDRARGLIDQIVPGSVEQGSRLGKKVGRGVYEY